MPRLTTNDLLRWKASSSSPPAPTEKPPGSGKKQFVYVHDVAGNDFEIWAIDSWNPYRGWYYEFRISSPNGYEVLSQCIYDVGYNDVSLEYDPLSTTEDRRESFSVEGTPIFYVGAILNVEHSNGEGRQPPSGEGLEPVPGGADFHLIYDFETKTRVQVNTVGGKKPEEESPKEESHSPEFDGTYHAILHAEAARINELADFRAAVASDTAFRRLDDPDAVDGTEHLRVQEIDSVSPPIGYRHLKGGACSGCVIHDQRMGGTIFSLLPSGVQATLPPLPGRSRATFALARSLFPRQGASLAVFVDGQRARQAELRPTKSMIAVDVSVNGARHTVQLLEEAARVPTQQIRDATRP